MKGFTIPNLIIHMMQFLTASFLAILPAGAALVGGVVSFFGISAAKAPTTASIIIASFFVFYSLISMIMGIINFLVISRHMRTYFIIELLLGILGIAGCVASLVYYFSAISLPFRMLLREGFAPIMNLAFIFILLCILNLTFTVLFAVVPKKTIKPAPGDPVPAPGSISAPSDTPLL
ncbi:MAG: hypothetical protein J5379_09810 [Clostridiales bacterium]|nr:hypothetical protein [Clostridiales bacterium]